MPVYPGALRIADCTGVDGDKRVYEDELWLARKFDGNFHHLSSVPFWDGGGL